MKMSTEVAEYEVEEADDEEKQVGEEEEDAED